MILEHVHISRGVTKLGVDIPSVNLPPVCTCRPNAPCTKKCYARNGRFACVHNKELLATNLSIWNEQPELFKNDVKIAAFKHRFFRWHAAGDIPNEDYMRMIVQVAIDLPATRFLCFTKKFEIVNNYIDKYGSLPQNLTVVFSAWGSFIPENPHSLPVAYVDLYGEECNIPADAIKCHGHCDECVPLGCSCWDLRHGQSVVLMEQNRRRKHKEHNEH